MTSIYQTCQQVRSKNRIPAQQRPLFEAEFRRRKIKSNVYWLLLLFFGFCAAHLVYLLRQNLSLRANGWLLFGYAITVIVVACLSSFLVVPFVLILYSASLIHGIILAAFDIVEQRNDLIAQALSAELAPLS